MRSIEHAVIGIALGAVPVIACFLFGWWISIPLVPESQIFLCALAGLCLGAIVDWLFLRSWIGRAYSLKPWVWKGVYVFYSVGLFGFFMGVPVFHVLLALPAGVFVGRRLAHEGANAANVVKAGRRTAAFTTSILALVCLASATVALASESTAHDLQGMLRIPFEVTPAMMVSLIVGGGSVLLALNRWLAVKSVAWAYRLGVAHPPSSGATASGRSAVRRCGRDAIRADHDGPQTPGSSV
jgi:hypothetical protein